MSDPQKVTAGLVHCAGEVVSAVLTEVVILGETPKARIGIALQGVEAALGIAAACLAEESADWPDVNGDLAVRAVVGFLSMKYPPPEGVQ